MQVRAMLKDPGRFVVSAACLLVLILGVIIAIRSIEAFYIISRAIPIIDQWDQPTLSDFNAFSAIKQHNEHRILFPRIIFFIDNLLWGGRNNLNYIVIFGCVLASYLMLLILAARAGIEKNRLTWAAGLLLALSAWPIQIENFAWGFQTQFVGVYTAGLGAIIAICATSAGTSSALIAMLLSGVAVYTMASGATVPVIVLLLAIYCGRPRWQVVAIGVFGALLVGFYLIDYHSPPYHSSFSDAPSHIGGILGYFFAFIGAPFADLFGRALKIAWPPAEHGPQVAAIVFGVTGCLIFGIVASIALPNRNGEGPARARLALLGMMAFILLSSALIAVGRVRFGLVQAFSGRYATPSLLFWMCLIIVIASMSRRALASLSFVSVFLLLLILRFEGNYIQFANAWVAQRDAGTPAFISDVLDEPMLRGLSPDASRPMQKRAAYFNERLSVFSEDWARWLDQPLIDHVRITTPERCTGSFLFASPLNTADGRSWRAEGALAPTSETSSGRIVLVDGTGHIVGYGLTQTAWPPRASGPLPWIGAFKTTAPSTVKAFALLDGNSDTACPIGTAETVSQAPSVQVVASTPGALSAAPVGGLVEGVVASDDRIVVHGRALLGQRAPHMIVQTNIPISAATLTTFPALGDNRLLQDARLGDDAFEVVLSLAPGATLSSNSRICLYSSDSVFGDHHVQAAARPDLCPE